jgi:hypothetical protein
MGLLFAGKLLKKKERVRGALSTLGLQEPALFIAEELWDLGMRKRNVGGNSPVRTHKITKIRTGKLLG